MASKTTKLGLTKPYESDYFNIGDFNDNMDKIDNLVHIVESGTMTATKTTINTQTPNGNVTWHYKKYDDGTLEAQCAWKINNWKCSDSQGEDGTWRSGYIHVNYPNLGQKSITYKNAMVAASSGSPDAAYNWVMDCSAYGESTSYQTIRLVSPLNETKSIEKVIYMEFKGTW